MTNNANNYYWFIGIQLWQFFYIKDSIDLQLSMKI